MTLTLNNTHEPLSFEPKETFIDKQLDLHFTKLKTSRGDLSIGDLMLSVVKICALLQTQARFMHRDSMNKMHPKILEETEIQAASYNSKLVWGLAIAGGLAALAAAGYGGFYMHDAIKSASNLSDAATLIQPISAESGGISAIGQFLNTASNLKNENDQGPKKLREHIIQHLTLLRDQFNQASQGSEGKLQEAERTLRELISALHQIAYTLFHNQ